MTARREKTGQDVRPLRLRPYRAGGAVEGLLTLPERCRSIREAHHIPLRTAAERMGVGYADLSRFENRECNPTCGVMLRIAQWVDAQPPAGEQAALIDQPEPNVIGFERRHRSWQ